MRKKHFQTIIRTMELMCALIVFKFTNGSPVLCL